MTLSVEQQGVAKALEGIAYALREWVSLIEHFNGIAERALARYDMSFAKRNFDVADDLWKMCDGHITFEDGSTYDTTWDLIFEFNGID